MTPYRVFLSLEAMEALRTMRSPQRRMIARFIESLKADPFQHGDYTERDEASRGIEIKAINAYAVIFWADTPVREIKVIDIRSADSV